MEKVVVMGCACVVVSSLTPEEINRFERYDPEALTLTKDGETVFSIHLDDSPGKVMDDGAWYSRATSADGKATITILLDPDSQDKPGMVQRKIGASLLKLDELEKQIVGRRDQLREMETAAEALVTLL